MNPLDVIRNEFFHLLGTDHIAVNTQGVPIARADSRAAVEQAAPDAAAYYSGADFEPAVTPTESGGVVVNLDTNDTNATAELDPVLAPQTAPVDPEPLVVNVTGVSASATAKQNATVGQASSQMLGTSAFNNSAFNNMTNPQAPLAEQNAAGSSTFYSGESYPRVIATAKLPPDPAGAEMFAEPTADPFQPSDEDDPEPPKAA